jgi:hypothetical protein
VTVPYSEAVEGYVELAKWWLDAISSHAKTAADKAQMGVLTPDDLVGTTAAYASLAVQTGVLVVNEALDAVAVVTAPAGLWVSRTYTVAVSSQLRTTSLRGPLQRVSTQGVIPVAAVDVTPRNLHAGRTTITVGFDATNIASPELVRGVVELRDSAGAVTPVNVNIPV